MKTIAAVLLLALAVTFRSELQAGLIAGFMQVSLFANCYGFISLFNPGFSSPSKPMLTPDLDMGSLNLIQLQFIYVLRYLFKNQFFLKDTTDKILKDIEMRLDTQFKQNGWTPETHAHISVPTHRWGEISDEEIFSRYIRTGTPLILKGYPSQALDLWTPDYFVSIAGDHEIDVINTTAIKSIRMTISDFVTSQRNPANSDVLYIRALSELFDLRQQLNQELGHRAFDDIIKGRFLTSQLFIGS